jgi:hypothetical protein
MADAGEGARVLRIEPACSSDELSFRSTPFTFGAPYTAPASALGKSHRARRRSRARASAGSLSRCRYSLTSRMRHLRGHFLPKLVEIL